MDFVALRTLIETHPTHGATSDHDMTTWLNDPNGVTRDKASILAQDIFTECIREETEWDAISAADKAEIRDILNIYDDIPTVSGDPARTRLINLLGSATAIKSAVAAMIPENVSRAVDAGLGFVKPGQVQTARTWGD